jgi:hypothetical protein
LLPVAVFDGGVILQDEVLEDKLNLFSVNNLLY